MTTGRPVGHNRCAPGVRPPTPCLWVICAHGLPQRTAFRVCIQFVFELADRRSGQRKLQAVR
jgi:hypothetical protein